MTSSQRLTLFAVLATVLGAISLTPVFAGAGWFGPSLLAVLVVAAAGHGLRALPVPRALVPLGALVALASYLHVYFVSSHAALGVLPTAASLRRIGALVARRSATSSASPRRFSWARGSSSSPPQASGWWRSPSTPSPRRSVGPRWPAFRCSPSTPCRPRWRRAG
jgi:hypothetical protein